MDFGARAVAENGAERLADGLGPLSGICAKAACEGVLRGQTQPSPAQPQPSPSAIHSLFESEFSPPKNASIARFQGLCCYQSGSGISDGFRGAGGCGKRRGTACGRVGPLPGICAKAAYGAHCADKPSPNPAQTQPKPSPNPAQAPASSTLFLRANLAPRKTPPSHGFRGFAAIKPVAE